MDSKKLQAYELIQERDLSGIKAKGTLLRHKKMRGKDCPDRKR